MLRKRKKDEISPVVKTPLLVFIHGGYWLLYLLLLAVIFAVAQLQIRKTLPDFSSLFPILVLCVAPNLVSFYTFYFLLFARFLARRKIFALVIFGTAACFASALSGAALSLVFFGFEQAIFADAREFLTLTMSLFVIAAIHGAIALVIRGFVAWFEEIKLKEELASKNYEMQIALVKSQINPHFLFNTLNNIDVLITKDAPKASDYLNKLSSILRYMVYETRAERIPLEQELEYIEKYLELQKIRTVNPDYVSFEISGEKNNLKIAPMILFPFIENAFKHTENKKRNHSIQIKATIEKERLFFECENSFQVNGGGKQEFGGLGNLLIEKRLTLLYPGGHRLEIKKDEKTYRVELSLDLDKN